LTTKYHGALYLILSFDKHFLLLKIHPLRVKDIKEFLNIPETS